MRAVGSSRLEKPTLPANSAVSVAAKAGIFLEVPRELFQFTTVNENGRARWPYGAAFQKYGLLRPAVPTKTAFSCILLRWALVLHQKRKS